MAKGYLPISLVTPLKLQQNISSVKEMLIKTNPDYDIVIKRLHVYYYMKLVIFGIDIKRNLIIQFPIFVQPYTQQLLILYQLEMIPVPIVDEILRQILYGTQNKEAIHSIKLRNIHKHSTARTGNLLEDRL